MMKVNLSTDPEKKMKNYFWSFLIIAALTIPGLVLRQTLDTGIIGMFYLLGIVGISFWWGRHPAIAASFLAVVFLDYFIIPPYYNLTVANPQAWMTLFVMLTESLVISALATKSRESEKHRAAAENEKNRNSLLSAVSHDLKTPLTGIMGAASSLLEDKDDLSSDDRLQLTRSIYNEAERLKHLVQNLLDMTRLEAGTLKPHKEWQSMEELVGVAVNRIKPRLTTHLLTLNLQPELPLAFVDGLLVELLLLNLLENTIHHTPPDTQIRLSVKGIGDSIELKVSDRGPGLRPGEEKSIFEKFIQGYHSGGKGSGLGLSICRGIVKAHEGTIEAANQKGGGAVFTVRLPTGGTPPF